MKKKNESLDAKMTDLESRSMRENLMFYGIEAGGDNEDCEQPVKGMYVDHLQMRGDNIHEMIFDRAHRVGQKSASKIRPIVVKFHYYSERESVPQKSFKYTEHLKTVKIRVDVQLPKDVRDNRKPLYTKMKEVKDKGDDVKFVGKKLFIDGKEFVPPQPEASRVTDESNMEQ